MSSDPHSPLTSTSPAITIRDATLDDVHLVSLIAVAALGFYHFEETPTEKQALTLAMMDRFCAREDVLYTYRHTRLALVDGQPAGGLISYGGDIYRAWRPRSFDLVRQETGVDFSSTAWEADTDEFYMDSMAILPAFRGRDIGHVLMKDALEKGRREGFHKAALIVDKTYDRLAAYYAAAGFSPVQEMLCFGHMYVKMVAKI